MFLVASLALFAMLLPACAAKSLLGEYSPWECNRIEPRPARVALETETERGRYLEDEIRRLERELIARANNCPVQPPVTPPRPTEQPEDDQTFDRDRWEDRDITMLDGCWILDSDYSVRNIETNVVTSVKSWKVCFDNAGGGNQELELTDGKVCKSDVTAEFSDDGKLVFKDVGDVPCTGGLKIFQRTITCTLGQDSRAVCKSKSSHGGSESNVSLRRER